MSNILLTWVVNVWMKVNDWALMEVYKIQIIVGNIYLNIKH